MEIEDIVEMLHQLTLEQIDIVKLMLIDLNAHDQKFEKLKRE